MGRTISYTNPHTIPSSTIHPPHPQSQVAAALGVDLETDRDLIWVAERALATKPPYPDETSMALFTALAAAVVNPNWPDKVSGGVGLMRNGWFRAIAPPWVREAARQERPSEETISGRVAEESSSPKPRP